ncbi:MAG: Plant neutral invertase [bacterium ADurb.Bin429]|nr:MAG: Plant neutral invertase [bacterium ADurb.Bin429]
MDAELAARVAEAKAAALTVLRHNARGPFHGLPRTAGWGYPEPYTRDIMLSALGFLASGDEELIDALRRTLLALATIQTPLGHIPSLASDRHDVGASDTTPLFLLALALYRRVIGPPDYLEDAARIARQWMSYQSPGDDMMVGQLPTSDWRDEQWVLGFGLFVNTVVYAYLRLYDDDHNAARLLALMRHFVVKPGSPQQHVHAGLVVPHKPYYALWAYKIYNSERFDLLGNSLAVLFGIAPSNRAKQLIHWVEDECDALRERGDLAVALPPNLFPYIQPSDPDWLERYEEFNRPGEYHNGGIWPFITGLYVAAVVAAGYPLLAQRKLAALTDLMRLSRDPELEWGFNEWIRAQDGTARGNDWQTWSAALYLYAASCVEREEALFFTDLLASPLHHLDEEAA